MKARIVIGANYGDEGKGTVVARYSKNSYNVLNVLTNGGSQRGHSILTRMEVLHFNISVLEHITVLTIIILAFLFLIPYNL